MVSCRFTMTGNFTKNDITTLFEENYEKVVNYIASRISNMSEAEELASDVFVKALEHIDGFKNKGIPIEAWLYKIAHNITIDYYTQILKTIYFFYNCFTYLAIKIYVFPTIIMILGISFCIHIYYIR